MGFIASTRCACRNEVVSSYWYTNMPPPTCLPANVGTLLQLLLSACSHAHGRTTVRNVPRLLWLLVSDHLSLPLFATL
ncbi:hypothetical protein IF1G_02357 [Cordyceps javanica]|uniref:Uncharacterized protein n=1 Tax=Cordyceps javanica TaxID=43265 RepID=A0A545V974_9HYPO|nr:hypothetical protein IF1G_02357 [Cordyceps javanica]